MEKNNAVKTKLLEAAENLILTEGHDKVTVRGLARATGYTFPLLYHYFKDLNALFYELRFKMIEDVVNALTSDNLTQKELDPVTALVLEFQNYVHYFFKEPNRFRFFFFYAFKPPSDQSAYAALELKFQGMWQDTFKALVAEGYLSYDEVPLLAKTLIAATHGIMMLSFSANGQYDESSIQNEIANMIHYLIH
ncbi:TetR/AcrR family transcriptional regulator [Fusibacter bizertensis]